MHALQTIHLFTNVYITRKHAQKKRKKTKQISFFQYAFPSDIAFSVAFISIPTLSHHISRPCHATLAGAQTKTTLLHPVNRATELCPTLAGLSIGNTRFKLLKFSRQKHQQHSGDPNAGNSVLGFHSKGYRSMVFVWAQFIRSYKLCSLL